MKYDDLKAMLEGMNPSGHRLEKGLSKNDEGKQERSITFYVNDIKLIHLKTGDPSRTHDYIAKSLLIMLIKNGIALTMHAIAEAKPDILLPNSLRSAGVKIIT